VVRGRVIAVLAGVAALAVAPVAHAQNGFPDYRQAAADQYPTQPPPATPGSGSGSGSGSQPTSGSSGKARPVHTSPSTRRHTTPAAPGTGTGAAPVAVPTGSVPAAEGSLPFTGSDLSGLIVLALILIAAGLFTAAIARATRRRRHAAA
jgi:hypothetical protein